MSEQDSDRNEEATPYKLQQAREKGSVPRAADVVGLAMLAGFLGVIYATGWNMVRQTLQLQKQIFAAATRQTWSPDAVGGWLAGLLSSMLAILAPLLLTLVIIAVVANMAQNGPMLSFHPLKPDWTKLNPATGFQRLLSMRMLFEAGKSIAKLIALALTVWLVLKAWLPAVVGLPGSDPKTYLAFASGTVGSLLGKMLLVLLPLALLDLGFARWEFARRMRMSKRDIKDETKNREGDPRLRARIRELRQEMLKRSQAASRVRTADVLITNPTHIAVALSYKHGTSGAPQLVAKGAGELAARMRQLAVRHQVPIVQNKLLARTLFREVEFDHYVPEKLYPQIAKIMVWVYAMREARHQQRR